MPIATDSGCINELTIYKTLMSLKNNRSQFFDIPSLWWKDQDKIIKPKFAQPLVKDLYNEMPGIEWDLLPMEKYRAHNWHCFAHNEERSPYASIPPSFGCPF